MTKGLLISRKQKFKLISIKTRTRNQEDIDKYRKYRDIYNKLILAAKQLYFKKSTKLKQIKLEENLANT